MTQAVANDDATTPKTGRLFAQATAATRSAAEFGSIFEKLIEGLPEQIALLDENWVVLAVNDSWAGMAKVFGYDPKPSFTVQNEAQISVPPSVNFDKAASAPR